MRRGVGPPYHVGDQAGHDEGDQAPVPSKPDKIEDSSQGRKTKDYVDLINSVTIILTNPHVRQTLTFLSLRQQHKGVGSILERDGWACAS